MLCLVRQPNSVVLEVQVDPKAKGQQCLDKVCEILGIIEVDYFGLQYVGHHGEPLWLNMRNQLRRQLSGPLPYRLQLRVKFFVPPHLVLQDITRHQFFLDVKQDLINGKLKVNKEQFIRFVALIAQAELGDYNQNSLSTALLNYSSCVPKLKTSNIKWIHFQSLSQERDKWRRTEEKDEKIASHLYQSVLKEHLHLAGTKSVAAEYLLLKEISQLEDFGVDQYLVRSSNGTMLVIGVGPGGVSVHDTAHVLQHSIPYETIQMATHAGRCFLLTYINENGDSQALGFKLENYQAASAIYRAVTEKHAFYSCETVRNTVTSQYIRDLKGTIASLFNEDTTLGKNYVFDIQRTCREVYDHTRRAIYQMESSIQPEGEVPEPMEKSASSDFCDCQMLGCKELRARLATLQDSMLCRVCMDADITTVFFPCRHLVCCSPCAALCECCPLCRGNINDMQHVYLPVVGHN